MNFIFGFITKQGKRYYKSGASVITTVTKLNHCYNCKEEEMTPPLPPPHRKCVCATLKLEKKLHSDVSYANNCFFIKFLENFQEITHFEE